MLLRDHYLDAKMCTGDVLLPFRTGSWIYVFNAANEKMKMIVQSKGPKMS